MSKTFDQTSLGSAGGISLAGSGCGCCALASIAYNHDRDINPYKTAEYLLSIGAFYKEGTTRSGMTTALNHYGFNPKYYTPEHEGGAIWRNALAEMSRLNKQGKDFWCIFLVVGTSNGGGSNFWTYGGHYLSVTGYRVETSGEISLYVRDSGGRNRTGWHYASELQYCTNCIWVCIDQSEKYTGEYPVADIKKGSTNASQVKKLQLYLNWFEPSYALKIDSVFGNKTENAVKEMQKKMGITVDGIVGNQTRKTMKEWSK